MIVNLLFSYFKPSQSKYSLGNKSKLTILCNYMNILRGDKAYTPIAPAISFKLNYKSLWKSNSYYNHSDKKKFYSEKSLRHNGKARLLHYFSITWPDF